MFDDVNGGVKTDLRQKVLLQLSVDELHIYTQKNATGFSMKYDEKGLVCIIYSAIQLILPPQLIKTTQRHHIICGCEICIQVEKYQYLLNR